MKFEMFSHPKCRRAATPGDDVVLQLPGLITGVFDGATDPRGKTVDDKTAGRIAAQAAMRAAARLALDDAAWSLSPQKFVNTLSAEVRKSAARSGFSHPISTTAALVLWSRENIRLIIVGDTGIRVNGAQIFSGRVAVDDISIPARIATYLLLENRIGNRGILEKTTRQVIFAGLDLAVHRELVTGSEADTILHKTLDATEGLYDRRDVTEFLRQTGIRGQNSFSNGEHGALSYGIINGAEHVTDIITCDLVAAEVSSLEMFTDGYQIPPTGRYVSDWENQFDEVEKADPWRTGKFAAVKGSSESQFFDDRTIVTMSRD